MMLEELHVNAPLTRLSVAHLALPPMQQMAHAPVWNFRPVVGQTPPKRTYRAWRVLARILQLPCRLFAAEAQDAEGFEILPVDAWVTWRPADWAYRQATKRGPRPIYGELTLRTNPPDATYTKDWFGPG